MKNKKRKNPYHRFLIRLCIYTILFTVLILIAGTVLKYLDFDWLYRYSPDLYYFLRTLGQNLYNDNVIYLLILLSIWFIGFLLVFHHKFKKTFTDIDFLAEGIDSLFDKNSEYISLPEGLEYLEKKLNHVKREAEKNERLAKENEQRKDELVVYLAHDIKTPLTSMIGYLSLLDEIKDMPKKQREKYIQIALDKAYKLEELTNELFDITRFNSEKIILEKEMINLNLMFDQIIDDFYPTLIELNKKIVLNATEKIMLYADSDRLARVFNNVIKNALYYSSENSTITITLVKKETTAEIFIENYGKQIPEEKLNKIFEKFYRLDSSRTTKTGGSGLGLAIAKEIVELHDGKIIVTSNKDKTTFQIILPLEEN